MLKKYLLLYLRSYFNSKNVLNNDEIDIVMYGFEALYINLTKILFIFIISFVLGIFNHVLIFFCVFAFLRSFGYGAHASKSIYCWIFSILIFIFIPIIINEIYFTNTFKSVVFISGLISMYLYAPSETKKRSIHPSKFLLFKAMCLFVCFGYGLCSFLIDDIYISNSFLLTILIESVMINPNVNKV